MNIILGIAFAWLCYEHIMDAIEPNRLTRSRVRWNSIALALITGFLAYGWLFVVGNIQ